MSLGDASALAPDNRIEESRRKIRPPFVLDDSMRFYSPQENREALDHPRVEAWHAFVSTQWIPTPMPGATRRLALLLPCTKYKPYQTSREHRGINAALLAAGWEPVDGPDVPQQLAACLDAGEDPRVLEVGPLRRGSVVLDRFVVSEPLALVPYEHCWDWRGEQSPATSYDDPGLFEFRGTSVSPHRADCTAVAVPGTGRWRWGPAERDAYVDVHQRLVVLLTTTLTRLSPSYSAILAWVSPGLTHRSFLADAALRRTEGLPSRRTGADGPRPLRGVLDAAPGLVEVLPSRAQLVSAGLALAQRLAAQGRDAGPGSVKSVMARGDGHDTPLGLPEALAFLVARLDELAGAS